MDEDLWDDLMDDGWIDYMLSELHQHATAAGAQWDLSNPATMDIPVNSRNADIIYGICRTLRESKSTMIKRPQMKKIKEARTEAHKFLVDEANNPATSIQRKIELVKLTSK